MPQCSRRWVAQPPVGGSLAKADQPCPGGLARYVLTARRGCHRAGLTRGARDIGSRGGRIEACGSGCVVIWLTIATWHKPLDMTSRMTCPQAALQRHASWHAADAVRKRKGKSECEANMISREKYTSGRNLVLLSAHSTNVYLDTSSQIDPQSSLTLAHSRRSISELCPVQPSLELICSSGLCLSSSRSSSQ